MGQGHTGPAEPPGHLGARGQPLGTKGTLRSHRQLSEGDWGHGGQLTLEKTSKKPLRGAMRVTGGK